MKKFVRESKFRHVYGQPSPKDQQFDGITASSSRLDGNICAVNRKFIAVVLSSIGGGVFTVLSRSKPGRYEKVNRCVGHSSEVIDLCFDHFNPNRIISGSEDGSFIVWWIKDGGLDDDISEYQCMLRSSQRRAVQALFHTVAADIVFCINTDSISIFNLENTECVRTIDTSQFSDQIFNAALNYDSTQLAVSSKDKKVRIFDVSNGSVLKELNVHEGSKPIRVAWLHAVGSGRFLLTTGATKMSERQVCVWDIDNSSTAVATEAIDNASGVLYIHYDADTSLVALFSKGEVTIRIFECDPSGQIFLTSTHQGQEPQRAVAFGNKLSVNAMANEIMKSVRVLSKSVEELGFIVPRRSDLFQDDLFPDTPGEIPALKASEFVSGKTGKPNLISLKDFQPLDGPSTFILTKSAGVGRATSSIGGASRPVTSNVSLADIQESLNSLKSEIKELKEKVARLESRSH